MFSVYNEINYIKRNNSNILKVMRGFLKTQWSRSELVIKVFTIFRIPIKKLFIGTYIYKALIHGLRTEKFCKKTRRKYYSDQPRAYRATRPSIPTFYLFFIVFIVPDRFNVIEESVPSIIQG